MINNFFHLVIMSILFASLFANNSQNLNIKTPNKKDCAFCRKFVGQDLLTCMKMQNKKGFQLNLLYLDAAPNQRLFFLKDYLKNSSDYKELSNKYSETKWKELWNLLSQEEKKLFIDKKIIACSKEDLEKLIQKKEDDEFWNSVYWWAGGTCLVVVTGGTIIYYYGPTTVSAAIGKTVSAASTMAKPAAPVAAIIGGALVANELNKKFNSDNETAPCS